MPWLWKAASWSIGMTSDAPKGGCDNPAISTKIRCGTQAFPSQSQPEQDYFWGSPPVLRFTKSLGVPTTPGVSSHSLQHIIGGKAEPGMSMPVKSSHFSTPWTWFNGIARKLNVTLTPSIHTTFTLNMSVCHVSRNTTTRDNNFRGLHVSAANSTSMYSILVLTHLWDLTDERFSI